MQIVEGRFYKTRDGRKVGPMRRGENDADAYWVAPAGQLGLDYGSAWYRPGNFYATSECQNDLISEWEEGPVVTETVTPQVQFNALCAEMLARIDAIDKATPWQETEPRWWLAMMNVQRAVINASKARADALGEVSRG